MAGTFKFITAAAVTCSFAFGANAEPAPNVVLVHGAFADGSGLLARR